MSKQHSDAPDSSATPANEAPVSTGPEKPPRSKVERAIVWGVIGIGVVIVLVEGRSYVAFKRAHAAVQAEMHKTEEDVEYRVTRDTVTALLGTRTPDPVLSKDVSVLGLANERYDVYVFKGLLKERTLCVHYGVAGKTEEPEVIEVTSIIPDEIL